MARNLGIDPDADIAVNTSLTLGRFPKELDYSYRKFVQLIGAQPLVGAWSVLQMDALTLYEDGAAILSQDIPSIVAQHPHVDISRTIGASDLLTYRNWVSHAAGYCEKLREQAQNDVANGNPDRAADLGTAQALCETYRALSEMADRAFAAKEARDAEAARQAQEQADRARREALDRGREFKPLRDADRWLDRRDRYERFSRTA